ncbi:MAG: DUF4126 family protein [Bacteroidota bacterium]
MNRTRTTLLLAAGAGLIAGLRSMSAPAAVSHSLSARRSPRSSTAPGRWLSSRRTSAVLAVLAAGELIADKMPFVPARIEPPALFGRAASGALCGAAIAGRYRTAPLSAAAVGAASAVASSFAGYHLRRAVVRTTSLPDPLIAAAEDAVVVAGVSKLTSALR